jgi:general secretion pathway protein L
MTRKRILLYLHPTQASWLIQDAAGHIQQAISHGNLADLTGLTKGFNVYVIVPGQEVLLTAIELPKLNYQRTLQALPFAVEEKLIDDVHDLHFAVGEYQLDHTLPIAVVAKKKMDTWLAALQQIGIIPRVMIPATLALPFTPAEWHISIDHEIGTVRTGAYSGFACDAVNLTTLLIFALADTAHPPIGAHLYNFSIAPVAIQLDTLPLTALNLPASQWLEYLAQWTEQSYPFINLLQGNYQTIQKISLIKKRWIRAGYLALVWIAGLFLSNIIAFFILHHSANTIAQAINTIYHHHFPQATTVVAPRERMEEKLKKMLAPTSKNDFLRMLGVIGNHLNKIPGIQLQNLDFRNKQLTLRLSAATFDSLAAFTQALIDQGLTVKQQSAATRGTTIKANLLISKGDS